MNLEHERKPCLPSHVLVARPACRGRWASRSPRRQPSTSRSARTPPGEHGRTKRKTDSDYAVRLREKQRLRAQYGIREAQLKIVFQEARRAEGLTGENLVELLEMRLDALVRSRRHSPAPRRRPAR